MSPEQVRKEQLTNQTDLFSVGVLFWEMLVGHRLFARPDPEATLLAVTEGEIVRPSSERPEIPAKLDDIVLRALERDKTARWADASEMLAALQKYLYALDDTPGPRDVAALVARFCPPETRRFPTNADPLVLEELVPGVDATKPRAEDTHATPPPAGAAPHTAVIPRDKPRVRPGTTRNQSFATHVQLKDMLERGTPLYPFDAIDDSDTAQEQPPEGANGTPAALADVDSGPSTRAVSREPERAGTNGSRQPRARRNDDSIVRARDADDRERVDGPDSTLRLRDAEMPPRSPVLVIAGLGGFVVLGIAIWMFLRNRGEVLNPVDAGIDAVPFYLKQDAPEGALDAPRTDAAELAIDGAATVDASSSIDAVVADAALPKVDARASTPVRDANTVAPTVDAAVVRPAGKGTLVIGVDPWCDLTIDNEAKGRAPKQIEVPAGKHVIECVFSPPDGAPTKQTWKIDLAPDAREEKFFVFPKQ